MNLPTRCCAVALLFVVMPTYAADLPDGFLERQGNSIPRGFWHFCVSETGDEHRYSEVFRSEDPEESLEEQFRQYVDARFGLAGEVNCASRYTPVSTRSMRNLWAASASDRRGIVWITDWELPGEEPTAAVISAERDRPCVIPPQAGSVRSSSDRPLWQWISVTIESDSYDDQGRPLTKSRNVYESRAYTSDEAPSILALHFMKYVFDEYVKPSARYAEQVLCDLSSDPRYTDRGRGEIHRHRDLVLDHYRGQGMEIISTNWQP